LTKLITSNDTMEVLNFYIFNFTAQLIEDILVTLLDLARSKENYHSFGFGILYFSEIIRILKIFLWENIFTNK
jgi:hypothetical protein